MAHLRIVLLLTLFLPALSFAQPGCPDPQASNYNPSATQNDGSCQYPVTNYAPVFKATLDNALRETSGITLANGSWWSHNDSGFDPYFFNINPENGTILKTIEVKNGHNRDWEDICSDGTNLFIGDFGNNNNDRENLGIYRIPLNAIGNGSNQSVNEMEYSFIPFAYPDQTNFETQPEDNTVFDCEAMIFANGKLHLFTKNRRDYTTTHYRINPLDSVVEKIDTFDCNGLITGASISPDGKLIALCGYTLQGLPTVFCWLLWDWDAGTDLFFSGNKRRIELGSALLIGQTEGIGFSGNRTGYITNEKVEYNGLLLVNQSTRAFDFSQWIPEFVSTKEPQMDDVALRLSPNPSSDMVEIVLEGNATKLHKILIFNAEGKIVLTDETGAHQLSTRSLPPGTYMVMAILKNGEYVVGRLVRR